MTAVVAVAASISAMAATAEEVYYTLDGTITGGSSGYDKASDIAQDDVSWKVYGNTTMNPWRIGGKSLSGVDRIVYTTTSIDETTTKVALELGAMSSITANSIKLIVASDDKFEEVIDEKTVTTATANATITFTPSSGKVWTSAYYKFIFNVTVSVSSNKFIEFKSAKFYKTAAAGTVSEPTISASQTSFVENSTVTITAEDGAAIYYTTDGTEPTAESTAYTAAFDVTETATVKAIAVKGGKTSSVASLVLTKVDVTSMTFAEAYAWCLEQDATKTIKYEEGKVYVRITFENAKVLYVDDKAIYVRQGDKAMQFYGFPFSEKTVVVNDILNGTYAGQLQAYKGIPELSASTKITTAANVTVTNSEDVAAAISATVAEIEARTYICDLVELTNVTFTKDDKEYFWANSGDNDVEVKVTNNLIPEEYVNKLYNIKAVVSATYENEGVLALVSCEYVGEVTDEPGTVTAVEGVNANKLDANAPIYNLQGQLVDKNAKGILIQNGKKIVVK